MLVASRIVVIEGHPDRRPQRFCRALADAYAEAAVAAGHQVRRIRVGELDFPMLRTRDEWYEGEMPSALREAQESILWAGHLVLVYPLWLGAMPALLKGFLEQVLRPHLAFEMDTRGRVTRHLKGRSARVVVTMGMPALVYRWYFRAHSLRSLERNILAFCGIAPVRDTLIGMVEGPVRRRERALERMRRLGSRGA